MDWLQAFLSVQVAKGMSWRQKDVAASLSLTKATEGVLRAVSSCPPTPTVASGEPAATCTALWCSAPHTGEFLELSESSVSLCTNADKNLGGLAKMYVLAHTLATDQDEKYWRDLKVRCSVSALS